MVNHDMHSYFHVTLGIADLYRLAVRSGYHQKFGEKYGLPYPAVSKRVSVIRELLYKEKELGVHNTSCILIPIIN